jgi:replication factor C small subunit
MNLDRKYRPTKFEDFIGNSNIVRDVKALLKVGDMPHFMFIGPPGSGKTTMAYLIARYYLRRPISVNTRDGDEDFIELNASDERGIDTIREKVQLFAKTRSETTGKKRIILLDEADSLTKEAQHALRPIVEKNEDRCIFIFSLNRIQGIQEPALISRCATFFFKRPEVEDCVNFFEKIAELEGVIFEKRELIYDVVKYYDGDLD